MSTFKLPGRKPRISDQPSVLLCAHLTGGRPYNSVKATEPTDVFDTIEVNVVGELEKRSPIRRPDHFVVVQVNKREVVKSEKKCRTPTPSWQEDHQL